MTLRLHWSPDSANLVIRIALEAFGMPYDAVRLNRGRGDHKSADYLRKNPQGLIPVLEDGELVMFETGAILWHLVERAGRLGPDGPDADDPAARAEALKWLFYVSNTVHADLRLAFYTERYITGLDAIAGLRSGIATRLRDHCDLIERQLGGGGLVGPDITVPDIYLTVCLRWAQLYPTEQPLLDGVAEWPQLHDLCRRVEAMPAASRAFIAEFIVPEEAISRPRRPDLPPDEVTGVT